MERISTFNELSIIVIGDVMLDSYWYGDTKRISPEAPVPVVKVSNIEKRPGGAANVALNIKSIGVNVQLIGVCGNDEDGLSLEKCLQDRGISHTLIKHHDLPTINKLRILSQSQQLMRLDFEKTYEHTDDSQLKHAFIESLKSACMVVISDYAKGTLMDVPFLIEQCKKHHIPVLIDPKGEDYSKYCGATMLTPNRKEFELVMGESDSEEAFIAKGQQMLRDFQLESLLVTKGAEGMTLFRYQQEPYHLAAQAKSVYDVTGAGDTVIGVLSTCLGSGMSFEASLKLANYAAGLVVGQVGAATVSAHDLKKMEQSELELSFDELIRLINQHSYANQKVSLFDYATVDKNVDYLFELIERKKQGEVIYLLLDSQQSLFEQKKISDLFSTMTFIEGIAIVSKNELTVLYQNKNVIKAC